MGDDSKVCLICGVDSNKKARYERYNLPPIQKKGKSKALKDTDSDSDSQDSTPKSKGRAAPQRKAAAPAASSRQTRNQNPKSFAASLCKVMDLPATQEHPFLAIFSAADYCAECQGRVKDVHTSQMELEKIQAKLSEARVDLELDLSKHLQKIPFCKNVLRTNTYERYKQDITMILDFHDPEKIKKRKAEAEAEADASSNNQPSITSVLNLKRKVEVENGARRSGRAKIKKEIEGAVPSDEMELEDTSNGSISQNDDNDQEWVQADVAPPSDSAKEEEEMEVKEEEDVEAAGNGKQAEEDNADAELAQPEPEPEPKVVKVKNKRDPNLKCSQCGIPRYFNSPQSLESHIIKAHNPNRPHSCDQCDRKFHTPRELHRHKESVHDGESLYTCGFCDQEFKQKRYLEDHLDQHPQAKPLNCQFCGRGFKRPESLQKGFQIYKGEPVDPCKNCGRNLNLKDYLEHNKNVK